MNKSDIDRFRNSLSDDERKRIDDAKDVIYKFVPRLKEIDSNGICGIGLFITDMNDMKRIRAKILSLDVFIRLIQIIANPPESSNLEETEEWFRTLHQTH